MKDEWTRWVAARNKDGWTIQHWQSYYNDKLLERGGLTAREWDHWNAISGRKDGPDTNPTGG